MNHCEDISGKKDTGVTNLMRGGFTGYSGPNSQYSSKTPSSYGVSDGPFMRIFQKAEEQKLYYLTAH